MKASLSLFAAGSLLCATAGWAFAHVQIGDVIQNIELTALDGSKHHLLSNVTANVFIFFKPGQEHSRTTMIHLAACQKEMSPKPVRWVAIVSDRFPKAEVEAAVKEIGIAMPVLIDTGDALYGKLGVVLCPVLGIADQNHKLVAYEFFTKVNFAEVVRARLRYLMNEINQQELERVISPPKAAQGGDAMVARRRLKLAEKLFQAKSYEKALDSVNKSIEKDATIADAYALKGRILAAQGNQETACGAFMEALKLDPANASAIEGMKVCQK
jgi:tetratricopeptide (TPR) repeat protein